MRLKFRYHPMVPCHPRTHQRFRSVSVSQLGRRRCIRFERHVGQLGGGCIRERRAADALRGNGGFNLYTM